MQRRRTDPRLILVCVLAGCASAAGRAPSHDEACRVGSPHNGSAPERLVIAVDGEVDVAHAPRPRTAAERLVFAQLYETLVTLDCEGRLVPGLASAWRRTPDGSGWIFTLRRDARFSDGAALTARDVAASWAMSGGDIASLAVLGDRDLRVQTSSDALAQPLRFADPAYAVARPAPSGGWPLGTGGYVVDRDGGPHTLRLLPVEPAADPLLEVTDLRGADPRNALDTGIDVLPSNSPRALDYAAVHPSYRVVPLPWDVTYALVVPERGGTSMGSPQSLEEGVAEGVRVELARDAVRVTARASSSPSVSCAGPRPASVPRERSIRYSATDATARALAERLVSLAAAARSDVRGASIMTALAGMTPRGAAPLEERALRRGDDLAHVASMPLRTADTCANVAVAARVFPLIDTRSSVILRSGVVLTVDGNGTLHFVTRGFSLDGGR